MQHEVMEANQYLGKVWEEGIAWVPLPPIFMSITARSEVELYLHPSLVGRYSLYYEHTCISQHDTCYGFSFSLTSFVILTMLTFLKYRSTGTSFPFSLV